jgi:hypothetical protein
MYHVNEIKFDSFLAAVAFANTNKAVVIEVATGVQRWEPAPKVSNARMRRYREQKAAYEAQQRAKAAK